jgi:hypothetical protein
MATFPPTAEQQLCIDKAETGNNLVIRAYAGCGKTTTLTHMAHALTGSQIYLAFNKSIVTDAKKVFPDTCTPMTLHGMAWRQMFDEHGKRAVKEVENMTGNINAGFVAWKMKMRAMDLAPSVSVTSRGWAFLVVETVKRWMRSGATEFDRWCVPLDGALKHVPEALQPEIQDKVLPVAKRLWNRMCDPTDELPLGHDGYLKLFALTNPQIPCDTLYVDEAQDLNGVVLHLVKKQQCQIILVGDAQQQIYQWRGAEDALDKLGISNEARLSKSFRFSPELADNATEILELLGETVPLQGNPAKQGGRAFVETPDTILSRTNAGVIDECVFQLEKDRQPCVVGGTNELVKCLEAIQKLQIDQAVEHPDFFGFANWREVIEVSEKPEGRELRRWVTLVEQFELDDLINSMKSLPTEKKADVIVSTGHKAKGREWNTVKVSGDFLRGVKVLRDNGDKREVDFAPEATPEDKKAELRLLYVACTRAMKDLDMHPDLDAKLDALR